MDAVGILTRAGVSWSLGVIAGNIFIDRARNAIVDQFLQSEATDLIFVDADVGFDPMVLGRVLHSKHAIVAGFVPKRKGDNNYHSNGLTGVIDEGMFQAWEAPTAFMRIKRSVFSRLKEAYPEDETLIGKDFGWPHFPYFKMGETKYGVIGEDMFFCRQWRELGEYIWIDSDITFAHRGDKVWKGNFYEHATETGLLR